MSLLVKYVQVSHYQAIISLESMLDCMYIGAVVGFGVTDTDFGTIIEGGPPVSFSIGGAGFSYGTISVQVTPLPCSDYPGNLTALFSNVPAASASTGMRVYIYR